MGVDKVNVLMCGFNDQWSKRFYARVVALGLQNGQLPLMPWESVIFEPGAIPNVRVSITIDEEHLAQARLAREAVLEMLGNEARTLKEIQKIVDDNARDLLDICEHFDMDLSFLADSAEGILQKQCKDEVLAALPTTEQPRFIKKVIPIVEQILNSKRVSMAGPGLFSQIEGILSVMRLLQREEPPDERLRANMSPFYRQCFQRLVNFAALDVKSAAVVKKGELTFAATVPRKVYGIAALEQQFSDALKLDEAGTLNSFASINLLKTYSWALTAAQDKHVKEWTASLLAKRVEELKAITNASNLEVPAETGDPAPKKTKTSSVSSSSSMPPLASPGPKAKGGCLSQSDKKVQLKQKMLTMFG